MHWETASRRVVGYDVIWTAVEVWVQDCLGGVCSAVVDEVE